MLAWARDQRLLESEHFDVRNPKTGKYERREHLWVPVKARKKYKANDAVSKKSASGKHRINNPDQAAMDTGFT